MKLFNPGPLTPPPVKLEMNPGRLELYQVRESERGPVVFLGPLWAALEYLKIEKAERPRVVRPWANGEQHRDGSGLDVLA